MDDEMMNIAVLVPAYNPGEALLDLLRQLASAPVVQVVLVNDGSNPVHQAIFTQAIEIPKVHLLVHEYNQGKGAALKTGLRYLASLPEPVAGVVTADADGQHIVTDILTVAAQILERPGALIIGGRRFDRNVPWKSMAGNTITRWVMRLGFGLWIFDTQTGLRGIPASLFDDFINISFNRFEYEQEMLMICARRDIPVHEATIRTIYFNQNKSTHFKPFRDSALVYFVIFRFRLAILLTWIADFLFFAAVAEVLPGLFSPTLVARLAALLLLYPFWVFLVIAKRDAGSIQVFPLYFRRFSILALGLALLSFVLLNLFQAQWDGSLLQTKLVVEVFVLFILVLLPKGLKRAILPA